MLQAGVALDLDLHLAVLKNHNLARHAVINSRWSSTSWYVNELVKKMSAACIIKDDAL